MSRAWSGGSSRAWRRLRLYVLNRDGWVCRLCWQPINPTVRYPHPYSAAVHHTLGRAVTGDDPRYLVAAHKVCNERAGDPTRSTDPAPISMTEW